MGFPVRALPSLFPAGDVQPRRERLVDSDRRAVSTRAHLGAVVPESGRPSRRDPSSLSDRCGDPTMIAIPAPRRAAEGDETGRETRPAPPTSHRSPRVLKPRPARVPRCCQDRHEADHSPLRSTRRVPQVVTGGYNLCMPSLTPAELQEARIRRDDSVDRPKKAHRRGGSPRRARTSWSRRRFGS